MTRRAVTVALSALLLPAIAACSGSPRAVQEAPHAAAPAAPPAPEVTSDRGDRVLAPTPVGRIAPEDVPTTPAGRR